MNFVWSGIKTVSALVVGGVALAAAAVGVSKLAEKALEIKQQAMNTDGTEPSETMDKSASRGPGGAVDKVTPVCGGDPDDELFFYQNYSDNSYMDSAETEEATAAGETEAAEPALVQSISSTEELKPTHTKYESGNTDWLPEFDLTNEKSQTVPKE